MMNYGLGVDTASGDTRNQGVQGTQTQVTNAAGDTATFEMTAITSVEDLQTALGVSVSANGGFGLFSASAKMSYAESCHFQSNSVFVLVSASVQQAVSSINAPTIDPAAAALLASGDTSDFQDRYGDMFVRGMITGGEFYGVIEISTTSTSDQESLSTSLSGSYGLFGASASVDQSFSKATQNRSVKVTCFIQGGQDSPLPTDVGSLVSAISNWPGTLAGKGVPYTVLLADYNILDLPSPPNYINLQQQKDVLAYCANLRDTDMELINEIDYVTLNQEQFIQPNMQDLGTWRNQLAADLNTIAAAASNALDNPAAAQNPTGITAIGHTLPKRVDGKPLKMVTIPLWSNMEDVTNQATGGPPTAAALGLTIQNNPTDTGDDDSYGDITNMAPPAGTQVAVGSTVTITFNVHRSE
jgi:hypothetical protein